MAYEVVRIVTQPFHGPDGNEVLHQPGDELPVDAELPHGLRTRLEAREVPDKPAEPKAAAKAEGKAAGR